MVVGALSLYPLCRGAISPSLHSTIQRLWALCAACLAVPGPGSRSGPVPDEWAASDQRLTTLMVAA
jgi:hypothetical protein